MGRILHVAAAAVVLSCGGGTGESGSIASRSNGLTVVIAGSGQVTSAPAGIDCPASCTARFDDGTRVTLTGRPAAGWSFSGWAGACSGTTDCTLTLSADASVSARFVPAAPPPPSRHQLTVVIAGQGQVTSSPPGIDCPGTCTETLADGAAVTLTAAAASGWQFSGWTGACSGAGCSITLAADATATAAFTQTGAPPPPAPISLSIAPATAATVPGGTVAFTAAVSGTADQGVLWSVAEGQAGGSVDATGTYTAPGTAGAYHVIATSHADSTRSAMAVVTVTPPPSTVTVTITPGDVPMPSNSTFSFTATVTGAPDASVTWSVREGDAGGTIDAKGFYISPLTSGEYHVVATSNADPSARATALVRTDTQLVDRGGLVLPAPTVYAIWWGSQTVFAEAPTEIARMFSGLEGTQYLRTLDQYMRGTKANVSFAGNLFDASSPPAGPMTEAALEAEICGLLDANGIAPRADGIYVVFADNLPPQTECVHDFVTCHGMTISVASIPNPTAGVTDPQPPDVCGRSQMVDVFSLCAIHELFEAMTDPTGQGWWDAQAGQNGTPEIADKCGQIPIFTCGVTLSNGSTWRLPYMWSNAANQCVLGTP